MNHLIDKQISFVDSTINVLKNTSYDVNKNFKLVNSQLNLMVDECHDILLSIMHFLINVNHEHINTNLLEPSQIQTKLTEIGKWLPNKLALPGKVTGTDFKKFIIR